MGKRVLVVASAIALAAGLMVGTLRFLGVAFVDAGPLGGPIGAEIGARERAGDPFAVPFAGRTNTTSEPIRLESVELRPPPRGLRLLGVGVCRPGEDGCLPVTSYPRWPPRSFELHPVQGYTLDPREPFLVIAGFEAFRPGTYSARMVVSYRQGLRRFISPMSTRVSVLVE